MSFRSTVRSLVDIVRSVASRCCLTGVLATIFLMSPVLTPNARADLAIDLQKRGAVKLHLNFAPASEALTPGDVEQLAKIAEVIRNNNLRYRIDGHADSTGERAYNLRLSLRRAAAVKDLLVNRFAIHELRLVVNGLGSSRPIADNATEDGRRQNRRVEIFRLISLDAKKGLVANARDLLLNMPQEQVAQAHGPAQRNSGKAPERVAVMPFENITRSPTLSWLGRGFAVTLSSTLREIANYTVLELPQREAVLQELKLAVSDLFESEAALRLGRFLLAQRILLGDYQAHAGAIRVTCRLVDVDTGAVLAAFIATGSETNIFALQDDLVRQIAGKQGLKLATARGAPREMTLEAYKTYVEARRLTAAHSQAENLQAEKLLMTLVASNGHLPMPHSSLAEVLLERLAYTVKWGISYTDQPVAFERTLTRAFEHIARSLALDSWSADGYRTLALALTHLGELDGDFAVFLLAEEAFKAALRFAPGSAEINNDLGVLYREMRRLDDAVRVTETAIALDPRFVDAAYNLARYLESLGHVQRARAQYQSFLNLAKADPLLRELVAEVQVTLRKLDGVPTR